MITQGKCPGCSKKIGRRTANGMFTFYPNQFVQVSFRLSTSPECRRSEVLLDIPVCKACAEKPDYDKIMAVVANEKDVRLHAAAFPDFKVLGHEVIPL